MPLRHVLALLLVGTCLAACGEEEEPAPTVGSATDQPSQSLPEDPGDTDIFTDTEVREALQAAGLDVELTGNGSALDQELDLRALTSRRYEINPSGREFELFTFGSIALARDAVDDLAATEFVQDGGAVARGLNVVAVFGERPREVPVLRRVERTLARLGRQGA